MTGSPASRSAPATVAGAGRRFGAPKTTRTAAPAAVPDATARATSGTPAVPAIAIAPASTTTPQSQLRRQDRESQGFPSVATAATAARKGSDGKRLDSTHVSPVTPSGICRWRDKRASSKAKSPAPAAPASATMSSRCQRRFTTSPTTTARGTARAAIWIKPSRNSRTEPGRRVTTRPTSVVTPSLVEVATRDEDGQHQRRRPPQGQANDVAGMPEAALSRRLPVEPGRSRRAVHGFRDRVGQDAAHVVPSRATAATTRSRRTVPAKRPPKPKISKRPDEVARVGPGSSAMRRSAEATRNAAPTVPSSARFAKVRTIRFLVFVDDAAKAQLTSSGEGEDAVDPLGHASEVRQRGLQLAANDRFRVDRLRLGRGRHHLHGGGDHRHAWREDAHRPVESGERPRQRHEVAGEPHAEPREGRHEVLAARRGRSRRSAACVRP